MKKIKILFIIIIAVVGAYLIYDKFKNNNIEDIQIDKFLSEYTMIDENHAFEIINIDETINLLNNKTGIIFFCNSGSIWCQYYAKVLDDIIVENNIEKVYYVDIKEERSMHTNKYQKIITKLNDYLDIDDTGSKRLNMPNLTFVKNGDIIANDKTTSIISADIIPDEYWNLKNKNEFKNKINEYLIMLNKEELDVIDTLDFEEE